MITARGRWSAIRCAMASRTSFAGAHSKDPSGKSRHSVQLAPRARPAASSSPARTAARSSRVASAGSAISPSRLGSARAGRRPGPPSHTPPASRRPGATRRRDGRTRRARRRGHDAGPSTRHGVHVQGLVVVHHARVAEALHCALAHATAIQREGGADELRQVRGRGAHRPVTPGSTISGAAPPPSPPPACRRPWPPPSRGRTAPGTELGTRALPLRRAAGRGPRVRPVRHSAPARRPPAAQRPR